jgi:hypothetical protein
MYFTSYNFDKSSYLNYKDKIKQEFYRFSRPANTAKKLIPKVMKGEAGNAVTTNNIPEINTNYKYFKWTGWGDDDNNTNTFLTEGAPYINAIGGLKNLPLIEDKNWVLLDTIDDPNVIDVITGYGNGFEAVDTVSPYEREYGGVTGGRCMIGLLEFRELATKYQALNGPPIVAKSGTRSSTFGLEYDEGNNRLSRYRDLEYADIRTVAKLRDALLEVIPLLGTVGVVSINFKKVAIKTDTYWKGITISTDVPTGTKEMINPNAVSGYIVKKVYAGPAVYLTKQEGSEAYFQDTGNENDLVYDYEGSTKDVIQTDRFYVNYTTSAEYEDISDLKTIPPVNGEFGGDVTEDEEGNPIESRKDYLDAAAIGSSNPFNAADAFDCLTPYIFSRIVEKAGIYKDSVNISDDGYSDVIYRLFMYETIYMPLSLFIEELHAVAGEITELENEQDTLGFEVYEDTDVYKYLDLYGNAKELLEYPYGRVDNVTTTLKLALGKDGSAFKGSSPSSNPEAYAAMIKELGQLAKKVLYPVILHWNNEYRHVGYMVNWDEMKRLSPGNFMVVMGAMYGYLQTNTPKKKRSWVTTLIQVIVIVVMAAVAGPQTSSLLAKALIYAGAALQVIGIVTGNEKLMQIGQVLSLAGSLASTDLSKMGTAKMTFSGLNYALKLASYVQNMKYEKIFEELRTTISGIVEETNEMQELMSPLDQRNMVGRFLYDDQHTHRYDYTFNYDISYTYV